MPKQIMMVVTFISHMHFALFRRDTLSDTFEIMVFKNVRDLEIGISPL